MLGKDKKETLTAAVNLSNVYKSTGDLKIAEDLLVEALESARTVHGEMSSLTATILNNLGVLIKRDSSRLLKAKEFYEDALRIRSYTLGNQHPDTIISMNNLAELHLAMGNEKEALALQEKILELMEAKREEEEGEERANAEVMRRIEANATERNEWKP